MSKCEFCENPKEFGRWHIMGHEAVDIIYCENHDEVARLEQRKVVDDMVSKNEYSHTFFYYADTNHTVPLA